MRSSFTNLALSLYVDHEPLNQLNVPNMCRVFITSKKKFEGSPTKFFSNMLKKKQSNSPEKKEIGKHMIAESFYAPLIVETFKYINDEVYRLLNSL